MVTLGDNLSCNDAGLSDTLVAGEEIEDDIMRETLKKVFSQEQRIIIECAFEQSDIGYKNETEDYWTEEIPEYILAAIKFGKKYKSDINRLKAIMNNIIKNKGEFIP